MDKDNAPRWIVDRDEAVLYERQADGSYKAAYKLVALEG